MSLLAVLLTLCSVIGLAGTLGLACLAIAFYCFVYADSWGLSVAFLLLLQAGSIWKARHALVRHPIPSFLHSRLD